jgi:hypothetical protein
MQSRLRELRGRLSIVRRQPGTTIIASLPISDGLGASAEAGDSD